MSLSHSFVVTDKQTIAVGGRYPEHYAHYFPLGENSMSGASSCRMEEGLLDVLNWVQFSL